MRITLHDNILPGAGTAHPAERAPISDAARRGGSGRCTGRLREAPRAADPFTTDFDAAHDGAVRRPRLRPPRWRVLAAWSDGASGRLVLAASVLLAGEADGADEAALAALCDRLPPSLFGEADRASLAAEPRPCLGTVYLDALWYDNGRVELGRDGGVANDRVPGRTRH